MFEEIIHRRAETPPDALVMRLIEQRQISSPAIQWGVLQDVIVFQAYIDYQLQNGHPGLTAPHKPLPPLSWLPHQMVYTIHLLLVNHMAL